MKKLLITICARGGSKSVPDKNIKPINNKALIGYTIEKAFMLKRLLSHNYSTHIMLSTDSEKIKNKAQEFGLKTEYKRPNQFATDKAGKVEAIKDVLLYSEKKGLSPRFDFILDMDITAPLRTTSDLLEGLSIMEKNEEAITLFSVSEPHRNPYFNMVEKKEDGYVKLVKSTENSVLSRQAAPRVFDMNASFYIYRRTFFDMDYNTAITNKSIAYLMPHICFDIDNQIDFDIIEYLIKEKKLDFDFQ